MHLLIVLGAPNLVQTSGMYVLWAHMAIGIHADASMKAAYNVGRIWANVQ